MKDWGVAIWIENNGVVYRNSKNIYLIKQESGSILNCKDNKMDTK